MSETLTMKAMPYDAQLIVCLIPGGRTRNRGNQIAYMNAEALDIKRRPARKVAHEKAQTRLVKKDDSGTPDLSQHQGFLTANTRVHLV